MEKLRQRHLQGLAHPVPFGTSKHEHGFEMLMPNVLISIRNKFSLKCIFLSSNWLKKPQTQIICSAPSRGQHGISRITLQKGNNALAQQQAQTTM